METVGLVVLLLVIGWQVMALRKEGRSHKYPTTVFYSLQSEEADANGIEESNVNLRQKFDLPIAITPGMEFSGVANNTPTLVARVVFDAEGRAVHLKSRRVALKELEDAKKWYLSRGWRSDA